MINFVFLEDHLGCLRSMKLDELIPRFCTSLRMRGEEPELKWCGSEEEESDIRDIEEGEFRESVTGYKGEGKERESIGGVGST